MRLYIIISLSFLSFILSSCSEPNPIVEDVCSVTKDICHYATLICDNIQSLPPSAKIDSDFIKDLAEVRDQLFLISKNNLNTPNRAMFVDTTTNKSLLIMSRNRLKLLYNQLSRNAGN